MPEVRSTEQIYSKSPSVYGFGSVNFVKIRDRLYLEARENAELAAYAMRSAETRGRAHDEQDHDMRPVFVRDRDRIIHSTAFRRLEYKTQVFVNNEGDYYRTRLTHTIEAAQVTRTVATALGLNRELAEAIALAHDLGHTPFGHAGEEVLSELMVEHDGFDHNSQSLRIVEVLEARYPSFPGLNLTYEVREGIVKHSTGEGRPRFKDFRPDDAPLLEAQIVDYSDEIAYNCHDIDDGLQSGLISPDDLAGLELWERAVEEAAGRGADDSIGRYQSVRWLLDFLVRDLVDEIVNRLEATNVSDVSGVREATSSLVGFSAPVERSVIELKARLMERLYNHHRVRRMTAKAKRVMTGLFEAYMDDPMQMPPHITELESEARPMARLIADYIAGMTDRFALDEFAKLYDPYEKV